MKYFILVVALLFCGTARADDAFTPFLGLYNVYKMQTGGSIHAPPCKAKYTPKFAKILVYMSKDKVGQSELVVDEAYNPARGKFLLGYVEGTHLNLFFNVTTDEKYQVYRYLTLKPYHDQNGKLTGEAEIVGIVYGYSSRPGKGKCWNAWVGLGYFEQRPPSQ